MEYFSEVVLPEITANQIKRQQNQGLEDLMVSFINSKTSLTACTSIYSYNDDFHVILKEFLTALDNRGVSHPTEKSI